MYMLKAQKRLQSIERREEEQRRIDQLQENVGGLKIVRGAISNDIPVDGPPGAKKKVKYVGSFKVYPPPGLSGKDLQNAISGFVWERIGSMNPKRVGNPISGTMVLNRHGVKLFKDKELFMAYPLKKITYCTAVPKNSLFAMVTRSLPNQPDDVVYCHTFGLGSPEQASALSQLMSEAFRLAFAHRTLRRSLQMEESSKKDKGKKKEPKESKSSPWDVLKRKKKSPTVSPTPSPVPGQSSSPSAPPIPRPHSQNLVPPTTQHGAQPRVDTSPLMQRSGSISSSGVTVEGLEAEVLTLEQKIASLEMRLLSLPPNDDAALELTINLSALEDQLQVKRQQLTTLQLMNPDPSTQLRPPSYHEFATRPTSTEGLRPRPHSYHVSSPVVSGGGGDLPPSYDQLEIGATGGADRYSAAFEDEELTLQDAVWYQAGLPRQVVMELLSQQPPGSFMVRDSSSNPGCHALSVKSPDGQIMHYLLVRDAHGYFIQGSDRRHPNLISLILYHASYLDFLPTTLFLGATNPLSPLPLPPSGEGITMDGANNWVYEDSDDEDEMGDEEMAQHLMQLQIINP